MAWNDQGRQEHGWFGHGHAPPRPTDGAAGRAELRARTFAAVEFAADTLGASALRGRDTRDAFRSLVPEWAQTAAASPNTFRLRWFGEDTDPVVAYGFQRAAAAIADADDFARLKHAGSVLAGAVQGLGLDHLPGFLKAAEKRAADDAAPIQRIAAGDPDDEKRHAEDALDQHLLPRSPLSHGHLPTSEEAPGARLPAPVFGGAVAQGRLAATARGQRAEQSYGATLGGDHPSQPSFLERQEVTRGAAGSVRPDFMTPDRTTASFEVKSYNLSGVFPWSMIGRIAQQAIDRQRNLPIGMEQIVAIDITGQNVSDSQTTAIRAAIFQKSNGIIQERNIKFFKIGE
jgi:hypothetical protein